jgi:spore maturation protein CgeB
LACGIPLICAPWQDEEALFRNGDFLRARNGDAMTAQLELLLRDRDFAQSLAVSGLETIRQRHTCAHRVDELLTIISAYRGTPVSPPTAIREAAE